MERDLYKALIEWKNSHSRMPLLLYRRDQGFDGLHAVERRGEGKDSLRQEAVQ